METHHIPNITVRLAKWPEEQETLRKIREIVFVNEQHVPRELEWDNLDADAVHFMALDQNEHPIGTARLLPNGQLGRMAVLPEWRNRGIGSILLNYVLDWAKATRPRIHLHAQVKAISFYQRAGFIQEGKRFMEAGIEHQTMFIEF